MKRSTIYLIFTLCLFTAIAAPAYFGYTYFTKQGDVKALERELSLEQTKLCATESIVSWRCDDGSST